MQGLAIDGSTGPLECREELDRSQMGSNISDAPRQFLLSMRAGGINLTATDTVVFYDRDWVRGCADCTWVALSAAYARSV